MQIKKDHPLCRCPFWSQASRRCSISRKGLLIPLDNQISIFCTSDNHRKCRHYKEEMIALAEKEEAVLINRRQHPRTSSEHPLTLHFISDSGIMNEHVAGAARTIDISAGGLQINTKAPLFQDSIIRFSCEKSGGPPSWPGLAKVKWCHYHRKILSYTAGLCFYRFKNELGNIKSVCL